MKLIKSIIAMAAALAATVGYAGDSSPFRLDTVTIESEPLISSLNVSWDASWIGGRSDATVVIRDNGIEAKRTTGVGEYLHTLTSVGRNELTYTTYIDGVAQSEVYSVAVYAQSNRVAFAANGGNVSEQTRWVVKGAVIGVLPTPTRTGYAFADWWTAANGGTQISASTTVSGNVTYYAHWTVNQYTMTFNANGGTGGKSGKQDYGSAIVAPTVTRTGYTFAGWQPAVPETVPASNVTYTAQWKVNQYTVMFEGNGGALGDRALPSVTAEQDYGSAIVAPTAMREGYTFAGWQPEVPETVPASNVTYTAQWKEAVSFPGIATWKFYEEADDDEGLNLAAWEDWGAVDVPFWIGEGICMAIPVEGNFTANDVVLVSGTYSDYGRPQVVSDEWMFAKHCTALEQAIGYDPYEDDEYDQGAYGLVFEDDVKGRNYSLSMDIWPEKRVVSGRQWILLEMGGNPTKGCKTFYLGVKGRDEVGYSRFRIYATPDQGVSQRPSDWSSQRELAVLPVPIGSGTVSGSGMYASGTRVSLSAKPNAGYEFEGWYDLSSGQTFSTSANLSYTTTGSDKTIFARFRQKAAEYLVTFDANGGSVSETTRKLSSGSAVGELPEPVRTGYAFMGWFTAAEDGVEITAATVVAGSVTYYAQWEVNHYTVKFNANGGEGEMFDQQMAYGEPMPLSAAAFTKLHSRFAGWATEPDGEAVYLDCQSVQDLTAVAYGVVTLYAVWEDVELTLAECVDASNMALTNDESAFWIADRKTFMVDGVSLRSGAIAAAEEWDRTFTTLTASVLGEGTGSFWWKVSCEDMDEEYDEWYDYAVFTIDGVEIAKIAGETDWEQVEFAVTGAGTHTLAWTFTRDDYDEDETAYENAAWVDGVVWTPKPVTVTFAAGGAAEGEAPEAVEKYQGYELELPGAGTLANGAYQFVGWSDGAETYDAGSIFVFPATSVTLTAVWELKVWTLGEAVDAAALSFTTGGDADWSVDVANGCTNGVSAKSGVVADGQSSWIEATVSGAGTLVFRWNVMGGIYRNKPFAYAKVEVDGEEQAQEYKTESWKEQTVDVEGTGTHTIRWTYMRTSARAAEGDCAWIDAVTWTPSEETEGVAILVNSVAVEFETVADGKTRTTEVAAGTAAEDIKVFVGGVDVTAGFKVAVDGTTATVALREPFERTDDAAVSSKPPYQENEDGKTVTLNVEVVPGLYYAADSAATIEALKRPGAAEPAKTGDVLTLPKQGGSQGFYKVWVSDAPIAADD